MSGTRGFAASVRRTASVARGTLRDLGRGSTGAIGVLLVVYLLTLGSDVTAESEEQARRVALLERMQSFAVFAGLVTLVTAVWSVAEDRRSRRLARWLATPLRPAEYVAGKVLGSCGGCLLVVWPLQLVVLLFWTGGSAGEPADFAPRVRERPGQATVLRDGREIPWTREAALLVAGDRVVLDFEGVGAELQLSLVGVAYERSDAVSRPPVLRVLASDGQTLAEEVRPDLPGVGARLELPRTPDGPIRVEIAAGEFSGGMLLQRHDVAVLGDHRPLWLAWARSLAGTGWLVLLASALASVAGLFLTDVLALVGVGVVLIVSLARVLLLEVMESVRDLHLHEAAEWVPALAAAAQILLRAFPETSSLVGAEVLSGSFMPYSADDPAGGGLALLWVLAAWAAGSLWLTLVRRRVP